MEVKNFKKIMAFVLFTFGLISNVFGLFNAIYRHNGPASIICTSACVITLILVFIISLIRHDYHMFLTLAVIITGMFYFPLIMGFHLSDGTPVLHGTRNPQTFYIYTFIPGKYSNLLQIINISFYTETIKRFRELNISIFKFCLMIC